MLKQLLLAKVPNGSPGHANVMANVAGDGVQLGGGGAPGNVGLWVRERGGDRAGIPE